jgi:hypothetical protein
MPQGKLMRPTATVTADEWRQASEQYAKPTGERKRPFDLKHIFRSLQNPFTGNSETPPETPDGPTAARRGSILPPAAPSAKPSMVNLVRKASMNAVKFMSVRSSSPPEDSQKPLFTAADLEVTDFWQTPFRKRYQDALNAENNAINKLVEQALEDDTADDIKLGYERNVPEHLPNSPLCPLNPKHKSGGKGICPMHGRKLPDRPMYTPPGRPVQRTATTHSGPQTPGPVRQGTINSIPKTPGPKTPGPTVIWEGSTSEFAKAVQRQDSIGNVLRMQTGAMSIAGRLEYGEQLRRASITWANIQPGGEEGEGNSSPAAKWKPANEAPKTAPLWKVEREGTSYF